MPYIPATCPKCGGHLKLDSDMEKGYCVHCGSLIDFSEAVKTVNINGPIEFEGYESFPTLYKIIQKKLSDGDNRSSLFRQQLNKALELDPDNEYLYNLVSSQIWEAEINDNALIIYSGTAPRVFIPEGITTINKMAFAGCPNLREIILPKSLKLIMPDAFVFESMITISAYNGTYAANYAMQSPAKLNLLDLKTETEKKIEIIESILREFDVFKKQMHNELENHFEHTYSVKGYLVATVLFLTALLVFSSLNGLEFFQEISLLFITFTVILTLLLVSIPTFIIKSGYSAIMSKTATEKQMNLFMQNCNSILKPLGIIDFKYHRNIFEESETELETEVRHLKTARDQIINFDTKYIFEKPKIDYNIVDYLQGKKPAEYPVAINKFFK